MAADIFSPGVIEPLALNDTKTLPIVRGQGDGAFRSWSKFDAAEVGYQPQVIVVVNFNGDGVTDVAATSSSSSSVPVMLARNDATYHAPTLYQLDSWQRSFGKAGLFGDGHKVFFNDCKRCRCHLGLRTAPWGD